MGDILILSLNCRGLQGTFKRLQVFQYLKDANCDILCLQDTHFGNDQLQDIYTDGDLSVSLVAAPPIREA